jgi:hypothetical protein
MIQHDNIHVTATIILCELLVKISPVLTIKNIGETEVCLHSFFTSALTESEWLTARIGRFTREKEPLYPLNGRFGELQNVSERC